LVLDLLKDGTLDLQKVQKWVDDYSPEKQRFTVEIPKDPEPVKAPEPTHEPAQV
jgi:hypothetical protein